jgi:hypothetical protein
LRTASATVSKYDCWPLDTSTSVPIGVVTRGNALMAKTPPGPWPKKSIAAVPSKV